MIFNGSDGNAPLFFNTIAVNGIEKVNVFDRISIKGDAPWMVLREIEDI